METAIPGANVHRKRPLNPRETRPMDGLDGRIQGRRPIRGNLASPQTTAGDDMTAAVELLARCRTLGVELGAGAGGASLLWEAGREPPADLLADLAAHKADVLALVRGPFGNCDQCGRPLDSKRRCWRCCDRPCSACGRPTGTAFIALCWPCGLRDGTDRIQSVDH